MAKHDWERAWEHFLSFIFALGLFGLAVVGITSFLFAVFWIAHGWEALSPRFARAFLLGGVLSGMGLVAFVLLGLRAR